eukprot:768706-Hanusia_phi.AAC.6
MRSKPSSKLNPSRRHPLVVFSKSKAQQLQSRCLLLSIAVLFRGGGEIASALLGATFHSESLSLLVHPLHSMY